MNFAFYLHNEINTAAFEAQLLWFKKHYNLVSIHELRDYIYGGKTLKNACMLSVDDGWRSTYDVIFPIMKKHNVPFTIFVSPEICRSEKNFWYFTYKFCKEDELKAIMIRRGYFFPEVKKFPGDLIMKEIYIDEVYDVLDEYLSYHPEIEIPRGFMNEKELLTLRDSGLVEIGAHTLIHPILSFESRERSKNEISKSIIELSELLDTEVKTFAYPNGMENVDFNKDDMEFARESGIDMAFSVDPGIISTSVNPLSIPRWGSVARLKFGRLGQYLPSRANQAGIRSKIREFIKR